MTRSNGSGPEHKCPAKEIYPDEIDIVISGISGRFPDSEDLHEFWENLVNGIDMITEDDRRWTPGLNGLPKRSGKIKTLDKFDAQFFGVHAKQAEFMDPQLRMLLEVTHEAIIDAGVNPMAIRGSRTGVFVGASSSESEKIWLTNSETRHGYALTGCNRGMFSNRISFSFDFQGPSFTVDTACSSSFIALEQAIASIRLGHCDAAIVAGSHLCLEPNMSLQFHRLSMLSPDGKCKSFDASANGYVRSEGVVAIFIQKKHVALRSYASVLAACTNSDGHKEKGVTFPSRQRQTQLLQETYHEAGVDPKDVVYVEAHGTGTLAGDPQELNAIADVFCRNRAKERPLLIGSVKSNAGHAEPASGLLSMAKVLLSIQHGILPANLHYETPNPNIPALCDGQLKVVAKNTPWDGGIVGMNSFGFGGANVHVILKSNRNEILKTKSDGTSSIPLLIPFSGRTKHSVEFALNKIVDEVSSNSPIQKQLQRISLFQNIAHSEIPGHTFRGHTVISSDLKQIHSDIKENSSAVSPVWFIFNGMGSQWPQMGRDLLKLPVFEKSIKDSAVILKRHGIDLMAILTNDDETALQNSVIKSFVAITSIHVALVDLLRSLDVTPSGGIIGYSVGELAASYADGCFTANQTVLAAFARGKVIEESVGSLRVEYAMAAVGLSWEEATQKCPPGIYPACHNAKDSVTISGPKKDIEVFVQNLKNQGIFSKEVNSSKLAFHSKYIEPAKSKFKNLMDEIIPAPQPRSARWISSSIPENQWNSPLAQFSSADYHVNNLISPVLFQESIQKIPAGSLVIEIGPHALLQATLKRSLPKCTNIGLVNKTHPDNSVFLLQALGKLYNSGLNMNLSSLYSPIEFPVGVDTPSISPLVKWDHSLSWDVPRFPENDSLNPLVSPNSKSGEIVMEISLTEESDEFYEGHKIDGRIIFPATGYFVLIWKAFASLQKKHFEQVPIVLENISILRATVLSEGSTVKFFISIFKGTGEFQIQESNVVILTGIVRSPRGNEFLPLKPPANFNPNPKMTHRISMSNVDAYKELRLRGYEYSGVFQGIQISDSEGDWATVKWQQNWASFLDTVLQVAILHKDTRALHLPTYLDKAVFDPHVFLQANGQPETKDASSDEDLSETLIPVFNYPHLTVVSCEGIQFQRWKTGMAPKRTTDSNLLRLAKFEFTPYFDDNGGSSNAVAESFETCLSVCLDIVLENVMDKTLKTLEILGGEKTEDKVLSALAQTHILNQPTRDCDGKAIILGEQGQDGKETEDQGQRSKVIEMLENAGIKVIQPTTENQTEIIKQLCSSIDLVITDQIQPFCDENGGATGIELSDQGFLLYHKENITEIEVDIKTVQNSFGLFLVAHKISPTSHFYLFKKTSKNFRDEDEIKKLIQTVEINLSPDLSNYSWVEELKMAMQKAVDSENEPGFRIYVVSSENLAKSGEIIPSGVLGLVNSLRKEPGGDKIRCFFLQDSPKTDSDLNFQSPSENFSTILQRDLVINVFQDNIWGSMRFYSLQEDLKMRTIEHAYLNVTRRGDLSSLRWFESDLKYHQPQSEICSVYYAPLNFRDVMVCTGKLALDSLPNNLGTKECVLGLEWSGTTQDGARVMGVVEACGLATAVVPDKMFLWNVPKGWSLAEASTVPVAYATAYYALVVRGKIQNGESVLIHAGAGGVGIAAIRIALSMNCTVYTTVGSQEKREFLMKTFPQLKDSSFGNSRDSSFLEHILQETKGRGVDLVLNSLAGDKLQASIKCLSTQGQFLEIGKVDLFNNSALGMSILLKNVSVHGILLDELKDGDSDKLQLRSLVQEGLNSGVVQPLNSTTFSDSVQDVEKAFRFMASGKHTGKILIEIRKEQEILQNSAGSPKIIEALPLTHFDPQKCYIIIGGLGGIGLELCGWLIERGARKLALVSRSGVRNGYQYNCLRKWRKEGATIITPQIDVSTLESAADLLKDSILELLAPLGGIFNLAMVLSDGLMQNQTPETFQAVSRPKINGTIFLDQAARTFAPSLEYFVVFSSVASGRGAAGLSNYAWANSAMERICEKREKDGLPGLAIMWGAIGDVGVLQEEMRMGNEAVVGGTSPQRISSCLRTLDTFLQQSKYHHHPVLSSLVLCEKSNTGNKKTRGAKREGSDTSVMEKVGNILGIRPHAIPNINPQTKLYELGMDSLMSVEIKQLLETTTETSLNDQELLELTFAKLENIQKSCASGLNGGRAENSNSNPDPISFSHENLKTEDKLDESAPNLLKLDPNQIQAKSSLDEILKMTQSSDVTIKPPKMEEHLKNRPKTAETNDNSPHPVRYLSAAFSLFPLILSIIMFIPVRFCFRIYLKVVSKLGRSRKKLLECSIGTIAAHQSNSSNFIVCATCEGIPNRSKLLHTFEERLVHWRTNIRLDRPATDNDAIYEPYESLQWRLEKGLFFFYWVKDPDFNIKDHMVFEEFEETQDDTLEKRSLRACEFYSSYDWSKQTRKKPQWQIRIIATKNAQNSNEFRILFSFHHSYGDALSLLHLVQFALCDQKQQVVKSSSLATNSSPGQKTDQGQGQGQGQPKSTKSSLIATAADFRRTFFGIAAILKRFHHLVLAQYELSFRFRPIPAPSLNRHYQWIELNFSKLKLIRDWETGKMYPVAAVILSCASLAYEQLYKKAGKLDQLPKNLVALTTHVISPYKRLGMINNIVLTPVTIPISTPPDAHGHGNQDDYDADETVQVLEKHRMRIKATSKELQRRLAIETLQGMRDGVGLGRFVPHHIHKFCLDHFSLGLTHVFSNVPTFLSRNYTYFGGYKLKHFHGTTTLTGEAHGVLGSAVDSANNTVALSLLVDDRAIEISPNFLSDFFHFFQEALESLSND